MPAEGVRADRGRAIHRVCVGRAGGGRVHKHRHGPEGLGLPLRRRSGPPGKGLFRVPASLPRCFGGQGLFSGHSGSRSHSPTGWKREKVEKEGSRDTLSQKVLRMASQHSANARGGGSAGKHPPPAFPSRFDMRATQQEKEAVGSRWTARPDLERLAEGPWAGSRRKLLPSLRGRKARPPGFPLALSPV